MIETNIPVSVRWFGRVSILVMLLLFARPLEAQEANPFSYFPMEIGNQWQLAYTLHPPNQPVDTLFLAMREIIDTLSVDDQSYFRITNLYSGIDTLRFDEEGRVWRHAFGSENLFFDFTALNDSMYQYPFDMESGSDTTFYQVRVNRGFSAKTFVGEFPNAIQFSFDVPEYIDEEKSFVFAPDVGLASISGAWEYGALYEAKIGERLFVTSLEKELERQQSWLSAYVYPNPVYDRGWLHLDVGVPGKVNVAVYDLLGRQVWDLPSRYFEAGTHLVEFDVQGLARGIYQVRVEHERGAVDAFSIVR